MSYRFVRQESVYTRPFDDPRAAVLSVEGLTPDADGGYDVTERLQALVDGVKQRDGYGIALVPQGRYTLSKTVYLPRAVRLFGFGAQRPLFVLRADTPGYQLPPAGDKGEANYLFWFTGNMPLVDGEIQDANPGTFYSALSNIDFRVEEGNPAAVILRCHFAQHCFVSHCRFDIGSGRAAIYDVGNEMENLTFIGGDYGIHTTKCSPGWPFVLVDAAFEGQRKAAIYSRECGSTLARVEFKNLPVCDEVEDGYWEKLFWRDCVMENISGGALRISRDNNPNTQINLQNLYCREVPVLLQGKETGLRTDGPAPLYRVEDLSHGSRITFGEAKPKQETVARLRPISSFDVAIQSDIRPLPLQETWVSARTLGAKGDGVTDDTAALQRAIDENGVVYLPQGRYRVSDTISLGDGSVLLGFNPISTQLVLAENTPAFAGIGSPKALLQSAKGGCNLVNGIGLDTAARNPRAVGLKWMAGADSYVNDVKFVGGHGQITAEQEHVPTYNPTRTADWDSDRPWDTQFWSLWITDGGGGTFKDIWSASPYAEAGIFISETATPGAMYQVSVEHHVRHEVLLRNVENWSFYGFQTEEEVAEGPHCQPLELSGCRNLLFANLYTFRVIWVDNPHPSAIRVWNCGDIDFRNIHNYTQMKYTIDQVLYDVNSGRSVGCWQLARLYLPAGPQAGPGLPTARGQLKKLIGGLDYVDGMCEDSRGNVYLCDSRLSRIYRWSAAEERLEFVTSMHHRPLSLICDGDDRLLVVCEYKPVPHSVVDGVEEREHNNLAHRMGAAGGCYFQFYSIDRRVRVYAMDPASPESSMELLAVRPIEEVKPQVLLFPHNQWRDSGDMMRSVGEKETHCYLAPDGKTAIACHPSLARATGLTPILPGGKVYLVDEYNKCIVETRAEADFSLHDPKIYADLGEYGFAMDDGGNAYIPDCLLYTYRDGREVSSVEMEERPANVLVSRSHPEYLYITARTGFYAMGI